jgi:hypothetical protein
MTYFLRNGNTFKVSSKEAMDLHDTLPPGNYVIKEDMFHNLFLERTADFTRIAKMYGNTLQHTDRMVQTFLDRPGTTGIMLTGEKGSGKTLLGKNISMELALQGIPTIIINAPWCGDRFNTFMQMIEQPIVILFDEFEKVYDSDQQESILTLLDGVYSSKKLFLLTCNDKWRVDKHMRNRPGRIYYMVDFTGLTAEFITEYCQDNLRAVEHIEKICQIASLFHQFNFDMLKALVEEMNRYGETPQEALKMLNAKPEFDSGSKYELKLSLDGKAIDIDWPSQIEGNPLNRHIDVQYDPTPDDDDSDMEVIKFTPNDLIKIEPSNGRFIFEDGRARLVLTKVKEKFFNYDAF